MSFDVNLLAMVVLFFVVAVIYSSAGFGGGSSYLAILTFFPLNFAMIRFSALTCNISVVSCSIIIYSLRNKWTKQWLKKNSSLLLLSIPSAFFAGTFNLGENVFFILLGVVLIMSSLFMFFTRSTENTRTQTRRNNTIIDAGVGGFLGGIAGMVGIGGGIFLSPYLHLTNWDSAKNITIGTSLFILFNSISGLMGQLFSAAFSIDWKILLILMLTVSVGSLIGVQLKNNRLSNNGIRKITAVLILVAGLNVLRKYVLQ